MRIAHFILFIIVTSTAALTASTAHTIGAEPLQHARSLEISSHLVEQVPQATQPIADRNTRVSREGR